MLILKRLQSFFQKLKKVRPISYSNGYDMYVLALSEFVLIRAEARLLAGFKPAPRVDDKLQLI